MRLRFAVAIAVAIAMIGCSSAPAPAPRPTRMHATGSGLAGSGQYRTVATADLDADGHLDIVGAGASVPAATIWFGNGQGGFQRRIPLPIKGEVRSVAVGDVDGDGLKDIVMSVQRESAGIQVWRQWSKDQWEKATGPVSIHQYNGVALADMNADGHIDIVAANGTSDTQGGIQIWHGDGTGDWRDPVGPTVTGVYMGVVAADFNEDGRLDLAAAGWGHTGAVRVWLNNGRAGWTGMSDVARGSFYGLSVTDVNGDGHLDLLPGTYRAGIQVHLGDGSGRFVEGGDTVPDGVESPGTNAIRVQGPSYWQVLPIDLDSDGHVDLVAGSVENGGVRAWLKRSRGWVPVSDQFPNTGSYYDLTASDLDGDGRPEVIGACFGEGIRIWSGAAIDSSKTVTEGAGADGFGTAVLQLEENAVFTATSGKAEYKIGPGDELEIVVWQGTTPNKEKVTVRDDGRISIGYLTDVAADGLTANKLDERITEALSAFIRKPRVDVAVTAYKSKFATVLGAVGRFDGSQAGGRFVLSGRRTVLELLSESGGLDRDANLSSVRIRRRNGRVITVDLFRAINTGDPSHDLVVDDGDLIFVPEISKEARRVYVFGEVIRPGVYTFKEDTMRVFDAVAQAGGVTIFAKEEHTRVVRGDIAQPEVIATDLERLMEDGDQSQNIALANGDLIYVPRSLLGDVNLFYQRIRPLLELIYVPGRIGRDIQDLDEARRRISNE